MSAEAKRPQIGQKCKLNKLATKTTRYSSGVDRTRWAATPSSGTEAYYIGYRYVHDCDTEYYGSGGEWEPPAFNQGQTYLVWLFVKSERTNPIYAFPEDVEPLIDEWMPI